MSIACNPKLKVKPEGLQPNAEHVRFVCGEERPVTRRVIYSPGKPLRSISLYCAFGAWTSLVFVLSRTSEI